MHYYKRNIGDYAKKAGRLSILQHGIYNLLIDACYDREQFPTRDEAIDWIWASTKDELEALDFVLGKFFQMDDKGRYVQKRIKAALENYQDFRKEQAEKGKKGGRPKKKPEKTRMEPGGDEKNPVGFSEEPDGNPNESQKKPKPRTKNQEPRTTKKGRKRSASPGDDEFYAVPNLNTQAWDKWVDYRKKRKLARYTTTQVAFKLAEFDHQTQMDAVLDAICNNWLSFHPKPKNPPPNQTVVQMAMQKARGEL